MNAALCAALRLADAAFGLGVSEPTQTLTAQDIRPAQSPLNITQI